MSSTKLFWIKESTVRKRFCHYTKQFHRFLATSIKIYFKYFVPGETEKVIHHLQNGKGKSMQPICKISLLLSFCSFNYIFEIYLIIVLGPLFPSEIQIQPKWVAYPPICFFFLILMLIIDDKHFYITITKMQWQQYYVTILMVKKRTELSHTAIKVKSLWKLVFRNFHLKWRLCIVNYELILKIKSNPQPDNGCEIFLIDLLVFVDVPSFKHFFWIYGMWQDKILKV